MEGGKGLPSITIQKQQGRNGGKRGVSSIHSHIQTRDSNRRKTEPCRQDTGQASSVLSLQTPRHTSTNTRKEAETACCTRFLGDHMTRFLFRTALTALTDTQTQTHTHT